MNYWMLTISSENYQVTEGTGFTLQGFRFPSRKRVERMQPGDRLLFYIKDQRRISTAATITSTSFVDHQPFWRWVKPEEEFAYRVFIRPNTVSDDGHHLDANQLAPSLEYVRKWCPEDWPLAFEGELHLLPRKDFELIERELERVVVGS